MSRDYLLTRAEEQRALWAALMADFFTHGEWRDWAERRMQEDPTIPSWLFDLSQAETSREASAVLAEGRAYAEANDEPTTVEPDLTSLQLGFLYLRHRRGEFDLADFLILAGDLVDGKNYAHPSPEALYAIISELRGPDLTSSDSEVPARHAEELLRPHHAAAKRWLAILTGQPGH